MQYILLIAMILGLLMYLLSSNAAAKDIGRILFASSVLAFLIAVAPLTVRMLGH